MSVATLTLFWIGLACVGGTDKPSPVVDSSEDTGDTAEPADHTFSSASECRSCHPTHFDEWAGSAMHMAASPTFAAFEIAMNRASGGSFAHGSGTGNEDFCNACHVPVGVRQDELMGFDPASPLDYLGPISGVSDIAEDGVSCDVCHTVTDVDPTLTPGGDGLGSAHALTHDLSGPKQGPYSVETSAHGTEESALLQSSAFCGTCHDVRSGKPDAVTGEPFMRVEDTFSEWLASDWSTNNSPMGEPVSCQGCHMSLYPFAAPGTRPAVPAVAFPSDAPVRDHALHAFTAVSVSLTDDPRFPNQDQPGVQDAFGYPVGQQQRREAMLQAACTLSLEGTPTILSSADTVLPVELTIENVGAGHGVPSGFSQEREVWIELRVWDDLGEVYSSGTLEDSAHPETGELSPDGLLDDEDLRHRDFIVDLDTLAATVVAGPDADQRPNGVNLGLVSLTNDFVYVDPDTGESRVVLTPLEANHADNSRALQPFQPRTWRYDVPIPTRGLQGDVRVSARLRFRAFPPKFLRLLSEITPELVTEEMVDRNTIVDMADDALLIRVK